MSKNALPKEPQPTAGTADLSHRATLLILAPSCMPKI
jgi:hypothetical protein